MACNNYIDHVVVLPEDDAYQHIMNGFELTLPEDRARRFHTLNAAGGWLKVLKELEGCIPGLRKYSRRRLILLMDFDGEFESRYERVQGLIPEDLRGRVYLLGASDEAEPLKAECKRRFERDATFESIGRDIAGACVDSLRSPLWDLSQLRQNQAEVERLESNVRPFLFG